MLFRTAKASLKRRRTTSFRFHTLFAPGGSLSRSYEINLDLNENLIVLAAYPSIFNHTDDAVETG
jgi:hypothetical protein